MPKASTLGAGPDGGRRWPLFASASSTASIRPTRHSTFAGAIFRAFATSNSTSPADSIPMPDGSQDFGYSLGVLHDIPITARAMSDAVRKLKPGAPLLVYLYYNFDNRPAWYGAVWKASDLGRKAVSRMPFRMKIATTSVIVALAYWPLSRAAKLLERAGANVGNLLLSAYRNNAFYALRTDALDRFGTRLEQRFSRAEIKDMMEQSGLTRVDEPYWVACGRNTRVLRSLAPAPSVRVCLSGD